MDNEKKNIKIDTCPFWADKLISYCLQQVRKKDLYVNECIAFLTSIRPADCPIIIHSMMACRSL